MRARVGGAALLVVALGACRGDKSEPVEARARAVLGLLATGKLDEARTRFAPILRRAMTRASLAGVWRDITGKLGKMRGIDQVRVEPVAQNKRVRLAARFERGRLVFILVFNPGGKAVGFFVRPPKGAPRQAPWAPPTYVERGRFGEEKVTVGTGPLALPGLLTLPKARPPRGAPAVVLVHGSGPQDRDSTLGPNRPFKDLAWGLASRGVAVLRYDKVTKAHPSGFLRKVGPRVTIDNETIDDAVAAVAVLRRDRRIDNEQIYVLGHSQGGMAIPRIGKRLPEIAGLIAMAAPTRPFEQLILSQFQYIASVGGDRGKAVAKMLGPLRKQVALVRSPGLSPKTPPAELPLGVPASFWLDLRGYRPGQVARGLKHRFFVLQGAADYQVTLADFAGWKKALAGRPNVSFKSYPRLGHTFMRIPRPKALPEDYVRKGHVAKKVVEDLANWIQQRRP